MMPSSNADQYATALRDPRQDGPHAGSESALTGADASRICMLDGSGRITSIGDQAMRLLALPEGVSTIGHWLDVWPRENHTLLDHALDRAQNGESIEFSVYCAAAAAGSRWIKVSMVPEAANGDAPTAISVALMDISAQKSAEAQKYRFEM